MTTEEAGYNPLETPASKPHRVALHRIGAAFAWFAAVGAVLGGLTG
jgi:hypothetical protein